MVRIDFDHWSSLCVAIKAKHAVREIYNAVISQYQNGKRTYHNLDHVAHCLEEFDKLRSLCRAPHMVELAIWYHDIIYDTKAKDNEEKSGQRALIDLAVMGASEILIYDVERLILLTKHDRIPIDIDGRVIVDVDLSILGQPPEVFDEYKSAIRAEYSWVPDEEFWPKRYDFLMDMLSRDKIFCTDHCVQKFERAARENLIRSLEEE